MNSRLLTQLLQALLHLSDLDPQPALQGSGPGKGAEQRKWERKPGGFPVMGDWEGRGLTGDGWI